MIINFKSSIKTGEISWHYKAEDYEIKVKDPKIIKCYEYLEKFFILKIENNVSVLYVYDAEGRVYDKIISNKDFFIAGIREGILDPEFLIKRKGKEPTIFIYKAKQKHFVNTHEIISK